MSDAFIRSASTQLCTAEGDIGRVDYTSGAAAIAANEKGVNFTPSAYSGKRSMGERWEGGVPHVARMPRRTRAQALTHTHTTAHLKKLVVEFFCA